MSFRLGCLFVAVASVSAAKHTAAAPLVIPFDAAYTVGSAGSTEPVTEFSLDGPAPWLYLDLPDGALYSFSSSVTAKWYAGTSTAVQFTTSDGVWGAQDKYWLAPLASEWEAKKATGSWRASATHSLVELVMIYGVGAPRVWGTGTANLSFQVTNPPPAMPGDLNNDAQVDAADLNGPGGWKARYGADVGGHDLLMWQRHLTASSTTAAAQVPEPLAASCACTALLLSGAAMRRRAR